MKYAVGIGCWHLCSGASPSRVLAFSRHFSVLHKFLCSTGPVQTPFSSPIPKYGFVYQGPTPTYTVIASDWSNLYCLPPYIIECRNDDFTGAASYIYQVSIATTSRSSTLRLEEYLSLPMTTIHAKTCSSTLLYTIYCLNPRSAHVYIIVLCSLA